jgi:NTP pyrophosphatase (non-canonical NTP hydrolase)
MSDRYVSPHALPEGLDRELLTILAEECAEVIKAVSKALRFGLADGYPGTLTTNSADIGQEVGDILCVVEKLVERGILNVSEIDGAVVQKSAKLDRYLQAQETPR